MEMLLHVPESLFIIKSRIKQKQDVSPRHSYLEVPVWLLFVSRAALLALRRWKLSKKSHAQV